MASAKQTPRVSRISRDRTVAYARKQRSSSDGGDSSDGDDSAAEPDAPTANTPAAAANEKLAGAAPTAANEKLAGETPAPAVAGAAPAAAPPASAAAITPPEIVAPWPEATPAPAPPPTPPPEPARTRVATVAMPVQASVGAPPAMPAEIATPRGPVDIASAESPTHMPGPREIPGGSPDDPASPPGAVPRGDSRSLRRRAARYEFALIYRIQTFVISRFGAVGTRGQWRVVEYPTSASASHAYAKECSRFVADGFSDYRE